MSTSASMKRTDNILQALGTILVLAFAFIVLVGPYIVVSANEAQNPPFLLPKSLDSGCTDQVH